MNSDLNSETLLTDLNKIGEFSSDSRQISEKSENISNKLLNEIKFQQAKDDQEFLKESKDIIKAHRELCMLTKNCIRKLIKNDCILSDLPSSNLTFDQVNALISLEKGQGICVFIEREQFPTLKVVLPKLASESKVSDLKKCIRCTFELERKRQYEYEHLKKSKENQHSTSTDKSNITTSHYSKLQKSSVTTIRKIFTPPIKKISWRYIWRTYVLTFNSLPLLYDNQLLSDYGIVNKARLKFTKRIKYLKRAKQKK